MPPSQDHRTTAEIIEVHIPDHTLWALSSPSGDGMKSWDGGGALWLGQAI